MKSQLTTESLLLRKSERFLSAKRQLVQAVVDAGSKLQAVRPGSDSPETKTFYSELLREYEKNRGRDLYFPFVGSGLGSGPFVELMDGSVKYDMITGIGAGFFGHSHPALMEELIDSVPSDIMQGNLQPGIEMTDLVKVILSKVGPKSRLAHGWLMCSGTMSNEVALKIIRQKRFPATKILAFKDCFSGRSTAMQEITDNPGYRQGQPTYGEVHYLPFYDSSRGLQNSVNTTLAAMKEELQRYPNSFAALMVELVQGEGGFKSAPREYFVQLFEEAKKANLAIWADEVQTFGRTGELFAYQKLQLNEYIDVVTIGKMLQACMVLYTEEYNPKPGLVAGTFAGGSGVLRTAKRIVEILCNEKHLGKDGKIQKMADRFQRHLERMAEGPCKGMVGESRVIGGMIAFVPFQGLLKDVKPVLMRLYELGVIAFYCGHGPYLIRLLPPLPIMTEKHVDEVCSIIQTAVTDVSKQREG